MAIFRRQNSKLNPSTLSSSAGNRSDNGTSWSNRYSQSRGGFVPQMAGGPRWLPAAAVVLLVLVILLGIFGGQAMVYRGLSETTFINRMMTECDDALSLANTLSRSGGAESAAILGRIRSDIHAIDTINEVRNTITGGGYYVPPYMFTELYSIIDSYSNNLKLGNVTMQNLTDLVSGLEGLSGMLQELR